jgi:DNA polymerase III delta prime subunit
MIRPLEIVEQVFWGQPEEELNLPLLAFPQGQQLTLRDAFENVLFIGSQGSGKTTSARTYYRALLKEQFGGLVLCVKESQLHEFRRSARSVTGPET